jgi:hypothetical protein
LLKVTQLGFKATICVNPNLEFFVYISLLDAEVAMARGDSWKEKGMKEGIYPRALYTWERRGQIGRAGATGFHRRLAPSAPGSGWEESERREAERGGAGRDKEGGRRGAAGPGLTLPAGERPRPEVPPPSAYAPIGEVRCLSRPATAQRTSSAAEGSGSEDSAGLSAGGLR